MVEVAGLFTAQDIADRLQREILVDVSSDYFTPAALLDLVFDAGREVASILRIPRQAVGGTRAADADNIPFSTLWRWAFDGELNGSVENQPTTLDALHLEVLDVSVDGVSIPHGSRDEVEFWRRAPAARYPRVWNADVYARVEFTDPTPANARLVWGPALKKQSTLRVTVRLLDAALPFADADGVYRTEIGGGGSATVTPPERSLWGGLYRDWHVVALNLAASKAFAMEKDAEAAAYYRGLYHEGLTLFAAHLGMNVTPGGGQVDAA